jgi:hypothetical protein
MKGAVVTGIVVINALSSSTVADDGFFGGFKTFGSAANVIVMGVPTVLFTGTVTAYQAYSANLRGTLTDSAIPTSWTASDGISTTAGSRLIRKVGGGKQAWLLADMGAKTAMIGLPTNTSDTGTAFPTTAITDFIVGDSYEVVTRIKWPLLFGSEVKVRYQALDVSGSSVGSVAANIREQYVLVGFLSAITHGSGFVNPLNCAYLNSVQTNYGFSASACSFTNIFQMNQQTNLNGSTNVAYGPSAQVRVWHGATSSTSGILLCFDMTQQCVYFHRAAVGYIDSIRGSGNTAAIVSADQGSYVSGCANVTATTSGVAFQLNAVNSAGPPGIDAANGGGIFS